MPEPLASLDKKGKAAVINYDVPEPTSYSGPNYIELPLPPDAFAQMQPDMSRSSRKTSSTSPLLTPRLLGAGEGVVINPRPDDLPLVLRSPAGLAQRLASLTGSQAVTLAEAGYRVALFRDISGRTNMQMVPAALADGNITLAMMKDDERDTGGKGAEKERPIVYVEVLTPARQTTVMGPSSGVVITVTGRWEVESALLDNATLKLDDGAQMPVERRDDGTWSRDIKIEAGGRHTVTATISATSGSRKLTDHASVTFDVQLADKGRGEPVRLPGLLATAPRDNTTVVSEVAEAALTVSGTAHAYEGAKVKSVSVTDVATGKVWSVTPAEGTGAWSIEVMLSGAGRHPLRVQAQDDKERLSAPQVLTVTVSRSQPFRRLKNRLLIVETLNLSSFLGVFGAGRVIKTFSLLPGERTTISVKSWRKSTETSKSGSSIVDSDATEAATDFEDTLNSEHSSNEARSEAFGYKVGAQASAAWGWGSASISAEVSGSANAAREEAVKNVSNAMRKHAMKASSNRSVTVNTEFTATHETGVEDSTVREIANINVSRTLNFVFRQMNQQHITLIHLTNVRIAHYTQDLLLDPDGQPEMVEDPQTKQKTLHIVENYREVPLSQLQDLLRGAVTAGWQPKVTAAITLALSGIPDYEDKLRTVFEQVMPTRAGKDVPEAAYLRFPRNLTTDFVDPVSGRVITVPGIVLSYEHIVMRTEGVMVDTVLGEGDGLDAYAHGLQEVTVDERRVALAERQAELERLALARKIIEEKDREAAELFTRVFPAPTAPQPLTQLLDGKRT